jgi:hypothetical protein
LAKKRKVTRRKSKGGKQPARPWRADPTVIDHLGVYFDVCNYAMKADEEFWFRGHADISWELIPSALRYRTVDKRNKALDLVMEFKRVAEIKLTNPPRSRRSIKMDSACPTLRFTDTLVGLDEECRNRFILRLL